MSLQVTLGALTLRTPILAAAGTFGYGVEFARAVRLESIGAIVTKTLTRHPRDGHRPPRLVETPSGMLNAVGLQNIGLEAFLREKLPALRAYDVPILVSLLGKDPDDVAALVQQAEGAAGIAGLELNLSCPNVRHGGAARAGHVPMVAHDPDATAAFVAAARARTRRLLIAKLSPDVTDVVPIAQAAEGAGADAVTLGNTFVGMSLDPSTRRSRLGTISGGLSGPAIRPLALYRVWYTAQHLRIPIIGVGGILRAEDAVEFLLAGATAVAVGTANFVDPRAPVQVARGLARYLRRHGLADVAALRGALTHDAAP